jgi:hypothetical protein
MAINTAEKRKSVAGIRRGPRVTTNLAKDAEWRQQAGRSYSGIAADAPAADGDSLSPLTNPITNAINNPLRYL